MYSLSVSLPLSVSLSLCLSLCLSLYPYMSLSASLSVSYAHGLADAGKSDAASKVQIIAKVILMMKTFIEAEIAIGNIATDDL